MELEKLRRRGFEEELTMNGMLFVLFQYLMIHLEEHHSTIEECRDKLYYFLAHQARKVYLNSQFKARLAKLDSNGAILVCDYKMRIPKSARETEDQFFGKHTKQEPWFTISSFDSVFETLNPRPQWIVVVSDNGAHYHNSELIAAVANWYQWYNIEIRGWYFLESGEAKTSVDSHHAQYIRIGHNLDEGEKIQTAIADLGGTSVANLEPIRDDHNVKTIADTNKQEKSNNQAYSLLAIGETFELKRRR
ncbi:uncharacterized protein OCT59_017038 [Rhizophagus irregularis]|uniref:uncharacterized protein n=1 Tax=Rhizophagus irregularis TaxID=588596 RepID=UPI0033255A55|nr:hypothetical protein OCT59_017038 [Rhizophagus irregularis]